MVTGNNSTGITELSSEHFDLTFSDEPASIYILLLEVATSTLKASWYHKSKNLITGFAAYPLSLNSKSNSIESIVQNHPYLSSDFEQTIVSVVSNNYHLAPIGAGFIADSESFSLTNELDETNSQLLNHELVSGKTAVQYAVAKRIISDIEKHFPNSTFLPHIAPRIEEGLITLKKSILTNRLCAHIENDHVSIIAFENRNLILSNSFYQTGKEDIAYYILYVAEVLGFDSEKIDLLLSGEIENGDETWNVLNAYWKRIKISEPMNGIDISTKLHNRSLAEFDYLTHQLLCV
jgi:hypothetical protein